MTDREYEILEILKADPTISHEKIAEDLFITRSTVSVHITNLIEKGYIRGRGYIFNEDYVVCIGSSNVDINGFATNELKQKDKNPNSNIEISVGGVARNIGENLSRLGVPVKMLTAVGDDIYGNLIIDSSTKSGMDMGNVLRVKKEKTCLYISLNKPCGSRPIGRTDMALVKHIDSAYLQRNHEMLNNARVIVVSPCTTDSSFAYLKKHFSHKPIFVDIVAMDYASKISKYIDIFHTIKANNFEIQALCDIAVDSEENLECAANWVLSKGVQNIYITLGENGVFYKNSKGVTIRKKALKIDNIVSSTGAGDAFTAGAVYSFLHHFDENKSVKFSGVSASIALQSSNAINTDISVGEILEKVREY